MSNFTFNINKYKILEVQFQNKNKNSFSPEASEELNSFLMKRKSEYEAVLFSSTNPGFFCVGGDLKYYSQLKTAEPGIKANKKISKELNELNKLTVPTLAIVDGLCIGGGVELVSAFDYVISSPSSLFAFWQRKIGLSFGWGGGHRLLERMSKSEIKRALIRTQLISSYAALDFRLIDFIVPEAKLKEKAVSILNSSLNLPKTPLIKIKKDNYFFDEENFFGELWLSEEHVQALDSFNKK